MLVDPSEAHTQMTLLLRAAVIAVPLLSFGCAAFGEEPNQPQSDELEPVAIPHAGGTPVDNKTPAIEQTTCSAGDSWSTINLGVDEKGVATRVVMKFGGRDATSRWQSELIADIASVEQIGETEVRIGVAQTMIPVRFERMVGSNTTRAAEQLDVRGITIGRQGDNGIVKLETVGKGFMTSCSANEAVEIGGVARKLIALKQ